MSDVLRLRGRLGMLVAAKADPAEIEQARAELADALLEARIKRLIEAAPPLSPERRARLAALISGGAS